MKQEDHQYNCFMVYATNLFFATKHDIDGLPEWNTRHDMNEDDEDDIWTTQMHDWEWSDVEERYLQRKIVVYTVEMMYVVTR